MQGFAINNITEDEDQSSSDDDRSTSHEARSAHWYDDPKDHLQHGRHGPLVGSPPKSKTSEWLIHRERMSSKRDIFKEDFSTRKPYEIFCEQGEWQAYPKALIFQCDLRDLREVDVVNGTFTISAYLHFEYLAFDPQGPELQEWELEYHRPRVRTRNGLGGERLINKAELKLNKYTGVCKFGIMLEGSVFTESFELEEFPFDIQDCNIHLALANDMYFFLPISGSVNNRTQLTAWHLLRPQLATYGQDPDELEMLGKPEMSGMSVRFRLQRKWKWHVVNHMGVTGVLSTLGLYVFAMEESPGELGSRSSVTFTLLLTITAIKFLIADSLPKVTYSTVLDQYMLSNFVFVFLITVENFVVSFEPTTNAWRVVDKVFGCFLFVCWALWHGVLVYRVNARLEQCHREYGDHLEQLPYSICPKAMLSSSRDLEKIHMRFC